jgi:hypothetical protein
MKRIWDMNQEIQAGSFGQYLRVKILLLLSLSSWKASLRQMGPHFFMEEDVVLVTLQYRLGPLGFLSLNNEDIKVPWSFVPVW